MEGPKGDAELLQASKEIIPRLKQLEASKDWKENGTKPCPMFKV